MKLDGCHDILDEKPCPYAVGVTTYNSSKMLMRHLMRYMRQLHQRRMTAFYLLPQGSDVQATLGRQLRFEHFAPTADRPRTLRELFADTEYEDEDELP